MFISGVILHRSFEKQYSKQTKEVKESFKARKNILVESALHPVLNNHKLSGKWSGYSSINITGDTRAIYKIEKDFAIFVAIGIHHQLYGK